jgi:hypothetical protein
MRRPNTFYVRPGHPAKHRDVSAVSRALWFRIESKTLQLQEAASDNWGKV